MKLKALNPIAVLLLGLTLGACQGEKLNDNNQIPPGTPTGSLGVTVRFNGLGASDVTKVKVSIASSDTAASAVEPLVLTAGADQTYSGTFEKLPVSSNGAPSYDLTAVATDANDAEIFRGSATGAMVAEVVTGTVVIVADSTRPSVPVFSTIPDVLPPNLPSQPFQAQQTAEFGDQITLATGTGRHAVKATVLMVTWSTEAYSAFPITLNLYDPSDLAHPFATKTQTIDLPARPAADLTCPDPYNYGPGSQWRAADGNCYYGFAFPTTFDLVGIVLPDSFAYGIAYNTQTWGYAPIGQPGPYDSLNVGVIGDGSTADSTQPSVGTDPNPDAVLRNYWNFGAAPQDYTGFVPETGWTGYAPAVEFFAY